MVKIATGHYGTIMNCSNNNIIYETLMPIPCMSTSLSQLDKEIKEHNFGGLGFKTGAFPKWRLPIINLDMCFVRDNAWEEKDGEIISNTSMIYETVAVAIAGIQDRRMAKYFVDTGTVCFFCVPTNEYSAEGELTKLSLSTFEEFPLYYKIVKNTSKSFVFRYCEVLNETPFSLYTHPMLLPLAYLQQEFFQNLYVGRNVEHVGKIFESRLPVVRFWEEVDGEMMPQYYTYEYKQMRRNQKSDIWEHFAEITLKKVSPDKVKQDDEMFFVDKTFIF